MAKRSRDARINIAKAALACFIDKGIVETSYKEIAQKAKVHQPMIKYYYKSFEDLFVGVLGLLLEDLKRVSVEAIEKHPNDPLEGLLEYSSAPLYWAEEKPEYTPIWTFFYHMASYSPIFIGLNDNIREGGLNRISLLIYRILEEKKQTLREGWTVKDLSYAVQTYINGSMITALTQEKEIKEAQRQCQASILAIINGATS